MQKLLSILRAVVLTGTASTSIVACCPGVLTPNTRIDISNKITSPIALGQLSENTTIDFLAKLQTSLTQIPDLNTIKTSDYYVYKAGTKTAIQDSDITAGTSLNIKIVAKSNKFTGNKDNIITNYNQKDLHHQDTIYIDDNGNQQTTSEPDLSDINSKEVIQIGFYQNYKYEIQVVRMPKTIEKVSNQLPSEITSLSNMFSDCSEFNQNISLWDTSNVTDMSDMFAGGSAFNQNISSWNTSNVTDMRDMFAYVVSFNQDISNLNVKKVTYMSNMFEGARVFNQDLSKWKVDNVINMRAMFFNAKLFNQDLSSWNVDKVTEHMDFDKYSGIDNTNKLPKFKN